MTSIELGPVAVVDDDASTLSALWRLLAAHRYRVKTFISAEELLLGPGVDAFACVVTDIRLGCGMSGLELGESIVNSGRTTPLIFMTGSADDTLRRRARALGRVAFLEKPFSCEALLEAVSKAVEPEQ